MQDYLQSLYEQCEFGEFSKDHPLQAALYTHSIRETTKNQAILDENVLELVKTVRKTSNHVKQWNFADADTLVDMVLDLAPPIYVEEASIGKSMSESLDDFRDLAAVLKVVSVRPEPPIQQLPQKRPQDVISAPVTKIPRSFTVPPTSKPVVSEEVAVKQRPFQSAKDQFKADVRLVLVFKRASFSLFVFASAC